MEQFGIVEALESAAEAQGWKAIYGIDNYAKSIGTVDADLQPGQFVLCFDFRALPEYSKGGKISQITYACLLLLGAKTDSDGTVVSLDETDKQKYDRRLSLLMQSLALFVSQFTCNNELELEPSEIICQRNLFADNLDFVSMTGIRFIQ